jgi:hypothetical protein
MKVTSLNRIRLACVQVGKCREVQTQSSWGSNVRQGRGAIVEVMSLDDAFGIGPSLCHRVPAGEEGAFTH